jgi:uncharacterized protein
VKIVYHRDLDGESSAAIAAKFFREQGIKDIEFIDYNYNEEFPLFKISKKDYVVIVDLTMDDIKIWNDLLNITDNVIWIDHHKTCLDGVYPQYLPGKRKIDDGAACVLTWKYFFPNKEVPESIILISDFDTHAPGNYVYDETHPFYFGLKAEDTHPSSNNWNYLLKNDNHSGEYISNITNNGMYIKRAELKRLEELGMCFSYIVKFEGYECQCINAKEGSLVFDKSRVEDKPIRISYIFDGKNYLVSLYTKDTNIDVSEICKKYNGGGHKGAAGFTIDKLPWENI